MHRTLSPAATGRHSGASPFVGLDLALLSSLQIADAPVPVAVARPDKDPNVSSQ